MPVPLEASAYSDLDPIFAAILREGGIVIPREDILARGQKPHYYLLRANSYRKLLARDRDSRASALYNYTFRVNELGDFTATPKRAVLSARTLDGRPIDLSFEPTVDEEIETEAARLRRALLEE